MIQEWGTFDPGPPFPLKNSCVRHCSDENIRLNESDCEESEKRADVIDNIPVNPDIYVARDGTECVTPNRNVPGRFATK
ncbi:hypothetical protein TNCV_981461 [Trichonephila clavipes]|nr:hypothetical protein TNCV_981461 [Trichonephila clavipes]